LAFSLKYHFSELLQKIFKHGDIQNTSLTLEEKLNIMIYAYWCRFLCCHIALINCKLGSVFVPPCMITFTPRTDQVVLHTWTYLKSLLFSSDSCCKQRNMVSLDLCKECLNVTKISTSVHEFHTFSGNYYLVVCSTLCNWRPAGTWPMDLKYLRRQSLTRIRLVCKLYEFLTLRVFRHLQIYHTIQGRIQGFRAGASS